MNTPKSKAPKRYSFDAARLKGAPDRGRLQLGLTLPDYLAAVGAVVTAWPHLEEAMILVLGSLLGDERSVSPARQVFHSIINSKARIDVMRSLLSESGTNQHKGPFYDEVLDEFASLRKQRNDFVHGIWITAVSLDPPVVTLSSPSTEDAMFFFAEKRTVGLDEIESVHARIMALARRVYLSVQAEHRASLETQREKRDGAPTVAPPPPSTTPARRRRRPASKE